MHDTDDTIVAVATAPAAAPRGAVRLAGPNALAIATRLVGQAIDASSPTLLQEQSIHAPIGGAPREVPCDLFVWPGRRSYTQQPTVELHTVGSPPLLGAIVAACVDTGARLAEPGEFTLRAFLAGRLDLTQAEAVLAVIDARQSETLQAALAQLAGGLSGPLHRLRDDLLGLLADLEAGLDFVEEEDVRFVEQAELVARIQQASRVVLDTESQLGDRGDATNRPRVAIVGPPNVGKSSLFNALVARHGDAPAEALVADQPGVTRDALLASVRLSGVACELVDTPGDDDQPLDAIDQAARVKLAAIQTEADLVLVCSSADTGPPSTPSNDRTLAVATMADLAGQGAADSNAIATSALTGEGLDRLAEAIADRLRELESSALAGTASRCRASLADARAGLDRAAETAASGGGDELVALELRGALDALGRVVGTVVTDDVLDQIFAKFCIGK